MAGMGYTVFEVIEMLPLWEILIWLLPPVFVGLILLDQYLHRPWLPAAAGAAAVFLLVASWQSGALWWAPLILMVGTGLCMLELIIPGFGFVGFTGIAVQLVGLYLVTQGILFPVRLLLTLIPLAMMPLLNRLFGSPGALPDHMVHSTVNDTAAGFVAHDTRSELIGREGKTLTALRPSGLAEINGQRLDVICSQAYLPAGSPVRVRAVSPGRVEVEPIE